MMNKIIIEIKGAGVINKGAYLMLLSILEHFKKNHKDKNIVFVLYLNKDLSNKAAKELGINRLLFTRRKGIEFRVLFKMIPFRLREYLNIYVDSDVNVILDASGFIYGDQWPVGAIKWNLSNKIILSSE